MNLDDTVCAGDSGGGPLPAGANVHGKLVHLTDALRSPPQTSLLGIGERFKHTLARGGDENFAGDSVVIGAGVRNRINAECCHKSSGFVICFTSTSKL